MEHISTKFLTAASAVVSVQASQLSSSQLAFMLWSYATLRHYDPVVLGWLGKAIIARLEHNEHAFSATEL